MCDHEQTQGLFQAHLRWKHISFLQTHFILDKTLPMFSKDLGGKLGTGEQHLSWVHIHDVMKGIIKVNKLDAEDLEDHPNGVEVYNLTAPNPVTNAQWTKILAQPLRKPACLPLPSFMVKLMSGEMSEALLLQGQKVLPEHLLKAGYAFTYPNLQDALANLFPNSD